MSASFHRRHQHVHPDLPCSASMPLPTYRGRSVVLWCDLPFPGESRCQAAARLTNPSSEAVSIDGARGCRATDVHGGRTRHAPLAAAIDAGIGLGYRRSLGCPAPPRSPGATPDTIEGEPPTPPCVPLPTPTLKPIDPSPAPRANHRDPVRSRPPAPDRALSRRPARLHIAVLSLYGMCDPT